ncbi:MAG: FtsX-like permease family protein [Bacteroidota bacterium]
MNQELPRFYSRLFKWFCSPELYEELQGDLEEAFTENIDDLGLQKARNLYKREILKMIRPSVWKHFHFINKHVMALPGNYFKTSLRAIKLRPFYIFANVFGLALALSICTIGYFNYRFNATYNTYFGQAENLYKVHGLRTGEATLGYSSLALAPTLNAAGIPAVRYLTKNLTVRDGKRLFDSQIAFIDRQFLSYFPFSNVSGIPALPPSGNEIVISEKMAQKLFNERYPVGKSLTILFPNQKELPFVITDVFSEPPTNTSFSQEAFLSMNSYLDVFDIKEGDWSKEVDGTFVYAESNELPPVTNQLLSYLSIRNETNPNLKISSYQLDNILEWPACEDALYKGRFRNHLHPSSVMGIAGSAIAILLLACFNFINTSIALSGRRLKEIAVRKIIGGTKKSTVVQFLIENSFMITLAVILSFGISYLLVPGYNALFREELIQLDQVPVKDILTFSLCIIIIVTILAAAYPSLYVSKFSALRIFRNKVTLSGKNRLMTILLTFQFALCYYNVFGLFLLMDNSYYQETLDRGYDIDQVVNIRLSRPNQFQVLENLLVQNPEVTAVAGATNLVGFSNETEILRIDGVDNTVSVVRVGEGYPEVLGLRLNKGSFFEGINQDAKEVLINKMLEDQNGKDLLNQQLQIGDHRYKVIGIVDDFNLKSIMLDNKITPTVIKLTDRENFNYLTARVTGYPEETNRKLEKIWYTAFPQELYTGFTQNKVTENVKELNVIMLTINTFLAVITILISVLGLYTLVSLKVQRKSKEFGVRKVLGATRATIVHLLGKDLYWMMAIAAVIGLSASTWVLGTVFDIIYAYHIEPEFSHFIKASIVVALIVVLTVGQKVFQTSQINPSQQLRSE